MKLFLTGATGFLGRNVLLRALSQGYEVFAPVRNPDKLARQLRFEKQTAERIQVLSPLPANWPKISPDFAILAGGALFERTRGDFFATNVDWTLAILRALPGRCRTVVVSSQSAGGPTPAGKRARTEADADAPITWYGESKLEMERSIRRHFRERPITILRPPMILGPRDSATLPLFRMATGRIRIKPGLRTKRYSFVGVDDLVAAIFLALEQGRGSESLYVASGKAVSDWELIASAAAACAARGVTLPAPQIFVRLLSMVVDASPGLRSRTPSLTRDRVREVWPDRWVVDGSKFERLANWQAKGALGSALVAAHDYYVREGRL